MSDGQVWESDFSILYALEKVHQKSLILTDRLIFLITEEGGIDPAGSLECSTKLGLMSAGKVTIILQAAVMARND